jgi:peptidoglycan/LPS O-acetylase OafA/YrhL
MSSTAPPLNPTMMQNHRFHLLDGLRGLAALLVVPRHVPGRFADTIPHYNSFLAVDFFFCLSGFVIAYSYEKRLRRRMRIRDFIAVRMIRLYPLAIVGNGMAIAYVLLRGHAWAFNPHRNLVLSILLNLVVLPNFFFPIRMPSIFPFDIPVWSLFYEMVGNICYAMLVWLKIARNGLIASIVFAAMAGLAYTVHAGGTLDQGNRTATILVALVRIFFSFFAGVLLFRFFQARLSQISGGPAAFTALVVTGGLLAVLMISTPLTHTGGFQFVAVVALFPLLVLAGACVRLGQAANRACAFLGTMSYPLYVLHRPLLYPSNFLFGRDAFTRTFGAPIYILCIAILSWAIGTYCDAPLRRILSAKYKSLVITPAAKQVAC